MYAIFIDEFEGRDDVQVMGFFVVEIIQNKRRINA